MNKNTILRAAILGCAGLLPAAGFAGPLGTVSGSAAAALQYRQADQLSGCSYSGGTSNGCGYMNATGSLPYNSSTGQLWTSTSAGLNVDISSSVDSNGLHARSSITLTNEPLDPGALNHYWGSNPSSATAVATWNDTLTISGSGTANMAFGFSLDGALTALGSGRADAKVTWFASSSSGAVSSAHWTFSTLASVGPSLSSPAQLLAGLAVQAGDVVTVQLRLIAQSGVGCQPLQGPMLCSASAASDLSHTLKFASIAFQDGAGHDLPGFAITSPNFDYNGLIAGASLPVPEPATGALFGVGLLAMLSKAARRQRH